MTNQIKNTSAMLKNASTMQRDFLQNSRFTTEAADVIATVFPRTCSRNLFGLVPPTMLLWSILRWEKSLATFALEQLGVDLSAMESSLDNVLNEAVGTTEDYFQQSIDFVLIEQMIKQALHESQSMTCDWTGTEHLLLACLRQSDPVMEDILSQFALSYDSAYQVVTQLTRRK